MIYVNQAIDNYNNAIHLSDKTQDNEIEGFSNCQLSKIYFSILSRHEKAFLHVWKAISLGNSGPNSNHNIMKQWFKSARELNEKIKQDLIDRDIKNFKEHWAAALEEINKKFAEKRTKEFL